MKSFNDYIIHKARDEPEKVVKARFNVQKSYEEQHLVFGWANVSARADGEKSPIGRKILLILMNLKSGLSLC